MAPLSLRAFEKGNRRRAFLMLEHLEMPLRSEVTYLNVLLNLFFQTTRTWKYFQENTRKNAQVVTSLQTSCSKPVHRLSTDYVRTACPLFVLTSLEQVVNNL